MFGNISPSNTTTAVERVDIDGELQNWVQAEVETKYELDSNTGLDNGLEIQVFHSPELGHSLKLERSIWTRAGWQYSLTTSANLLNHRFTLLELKVLRDALTLFIDTADADGFGEE